MDARYGSSPTATTSSPSIAGSLDVAGVVAAENVPTESAVAAPAAGGSSPPLESAAESSRAESRRAGRRAGYVRRRDPLEEREAAKDEPRAPAGLSRPTLPGDALAVAGSSHKGVHQQRPGSLEQERGGPPVSRFRERRGLPMVTLHLPDFEDPPQQAQAAPSPPVPSAPAGKGAQEALEEALEEELLAAAESTGVPVEAFSLLRADVSRTLRRLARGRERRAGLAEVAGVYRELDAGVREGFAGLAAGGASGADLIRESKRLGGVIARKVLTGRVNAREDRRSGASSAAGGSGAPPASAKEEAKDEIARLDRRVPQTLGDPLAPAAGERPEAAAAAAEEHVEAAAEEIGPQAKQEFNGLAEAVKQDGGREALAPAADTAKAAPGKSERNAAAAVNLGDVPLGLAGSRTPSPPTAARPMPVIGPVRSGQTGPPERGAVASIPQYRRLEVKPVLTEHVFDLASLVAENGGTAAVGELSSALTARIRQTVGAGALGRALLKLEVGSTDFTVVGLTVAQSVARQLNHRIVLVPAPGAPPVNICP